MPSGGKRANSGRNKGEADSPKRHLQNLLKPHAETAIKTLVTNLSDDSPKIRQDAAKEILDRAYGKAPVAITGEDGGDIQITLNKIIHSATD